MDNDKLVLLSKPASCDEFTDLARSGSSVRPWKRS